jgi:hypothetical protein
MLMFFNEGAQVVYGASMNCQLPIANAELLIKSPL